MWRERTFRAMNTGVAAWLLCGDRRQADRALDAVERFFLQVEYALSRFRAASEVSALNRQRRVRPSRMLLDVLRDAQVMRADTGGIYDPLTGAQVIAAGYDKTFDAIGSGVTLRGLAASTGFPASGGRIEFHADGAVALPEGALLDLGGIAKGWAADRAAEFLARLGPCCVDAGGDIRVAGAWPESEGFRVEVEDPLQPAAVLDTLTLSAGAIATSGIGKRWWLRNGDVRHHLIDPRTGQPADNNLLSVTVRAPTAVEADIAAKTAFILGEDEAWPWLDERELAALFVYRDGAKVSNLPSTAPAPSGPPRKLGAAPGWA